MVLARRDDGPMSEADRSQVRTNVVPCKADHRRICELVAVVDDRCGESLCEIWGTGLLRDPVIQLRELLSGAGRVDDAAAQESRSARRSVCI